MLRALAIKKKGTLFSTVVAVSSVISSTSTSQLPAQKRDDSPKAWSVFRYLLFEENLENTNNNTQIDSTKTVVSTVVEVQFYSDNLSPEVQDVHWSH